MNAEQIQKVSQEQNISERSARKNAKNNVSLSEREAKQQMADLSALENSYSEQIRKEDRQMTALVKLISYILDVKNRGLDATSLIELGQSLVSLFPFDPTFEEMADQTIELDEPSHFRVLDRVVCYYDGKDLIKRDGHFLVADLTNISTKDLLKIRPAVLHDDVAALLKDAKNDETVKVIFNGRRLVPASGFCDFFKTKILLYKESAESVIQSKSNTDIGTRQRRLISHACIQKINKDYKPRADHRRWNLNRIRTAAADSAESILFMQALSQKLFTGEIDQMSFNDLTNILSYLDAVDANDLGKNSYLSDPGYQTQRAHLEKILPILKTSVFSRASRAAAAKEPYHWNNDCNRVRLLQEIVQNVLSNTIKQADSFLSKPKQPQLKKFVEGIQFLRDEAARASENLLKAFPLLKNVETHLQDAHIYLEQHEKEIAEAIHQFIASWEKMVSKTFGLGIAVQSTSILKSLHLTHEEQNDLVNILFKIHVQDPAKIELLLKDLLKGTPMSPAKLSILHSLEAHKESFMFHQSMMDHIRYQWQKNHRILS